MWRWNYNVILTNQSQSDSAIPTAGWLTVRHFSSPVGGANAKRQKPLKVCSSWRSSPVGDSSHRVPRTFWSKMPVHNLYRLVTWVALNEFSPFYSHICTSALCYTNTPTTLEEMVAGSPVTPAMPHVFPLSSAREKRRNTKAEIWRDKAATWWAIKQLRLKTKDENMKQNLRGETLG